MNSSFATLVRRDASITFFALLVIVDRAGKCVVVTPNKITLRTAQTADKRSRSAPPQLRLDLSLFLLFGLPALRSCQAPCGLPCRPGPRARSH